MKVLLNLLPEEGRELIRQKYHYRFLLWQAVLLIFVEVFYIAILGSVFLVLRVNHDVLEATAQERNQVKSDVKALGAYEGKFQEANRLAGQSLVFSQKHFRWTELLLRLADLVPGGVSLSRLSTKDYQVFIAGNAKTRDDFLLFEKQIKAEACFSDFNIPVSSLFSQENVDFQIDFSVKDDCIRMKL
jgi:Tfp pilus assembly protein PilN